MNESQLWVRELQPATLRVFRRQTRAYSSGQSEFVTRSDRRGRELEARKAVPVARLPARIDGAMPLG
jgi:hypothetical protein